jgi:hypothetical protein
MLLDLLLGKEKSKPEIIDFSDRVIEYEGKRYRAVIVLKEYRYRRPRWPFITRRKRVVTFDFLKPFPPIPGKYEMDELTSVAFPDVDSIDAGIENLITRLVEAHAAGTGNSP